MLDFYKYHGAGNDFILIDAREEIPSLNTQEIEMLCNRHKGIGADGLMFLLKSKKYDFEMKYFNSNGKEGSMCGNGGRCICSFAWDRGIEKKVMIFNAIDGVHHANILDLHKIEKTIELEMSPVNLVIKEGDDFEINTGSPHYIQFIQNVKEINVFEEGKKIRNSPHYSQEGINVNFVEEQDDKLFVRTYERGVENETLACGTGVTAAAIASAIRQNLKYQEFDIKTLGGNLKVAFNAVSLQKITNIKLTGPATYVFKGKIEL